MSNRMKKALVVVLGELARSPRMQYHCISLASNNYQVNVIAKGHSEDKAFEELESNKNINQKHMPEMPDYMKKYLPQFLVYIVKPIWQTFALLYYLFFVISVAHVIIVQNPPSIPTLPVLTIFSKLTGSKLIIDWHNYGYSILGLTMRKKTHLLVRLYKTLEVFFGRLANAGFCVSEAMKKDLAENFQITYPIYVLYDKPPKHYKPLSLREKHNFYLKMKNQIPEFKSPTEDYFGVRPSTPTERRGTRFTMTDVINKNVIMRRPNRPAIVMSSTSWTEDEDFGLLLEALKRYDATRSKQLLSGEDCCAQMGEICLPSLVCVITGKGPLKEYYTTKIKEEFKFEHIEIVLPWLSASDYAKMVASSDLGISLHSSSSGVDLPMKVVDMFGCGIPVLAYHYQAIGELVEEDFYGLTFKSSGDLFTKLALLLGNFYLEDTCSRDDIEQLSSLGRYKKNIKRRFLLSRWEDNWNREAKPVLESLRVA